MDWWSLGVIIYELIVGIPPFNDDTESQIFDNIIQLKITWPPIGTTIKMEYILTLIIKVIMKDV